MDFDSIDLSSVEDDLKRQAANIKDVNKAMRSKYRAIDKFYAIKRKNDKLATKNAVKLKKASNKPFIKLISTAGLVIWLMKYMSDHHQDKISDNDRKELYKELKDSGLTKEEIDKAIQQAESSNSKPSSNSSYPGIAGNINKLVNKF